MSESQPKRPSGAKPRRPKKEIPIRAEQKASQSVVPADSEVTEAELERIAELLPPEERRELLFRFASHKGWLPPPAMIREYESVLPGLAERIVAMPEREQKHRHEYMNTEARRQYRIRRRGQDYALTGMGLVFAFAVFLALIGQPIWAARLVIFTLVGIVGIFVTGKWFDRRAQKAEPSEDEE